MSAIEAKGELRSSIQNRVYPKNALQLQLLGRFRVVKVADRDRSCCACLALIVKNLDYSHLFLQVYLYPIALFRLG